MRRTRRAAEDRTWRDQVGCHRVRKKTKKQEEPDGDLGMEMADIIFVLICIANREGIDLQEAFDRMMAKVEHRDDARWTKKR